VSVSGQGASSPPPFPCQPRSRMATIYPDPVLPHSSLTRAACIRLVGAVRSRLHLPSKMSARRPSPSPLPGRPRSGRPRSTNLPPRLRRAVRPARRASPRALEPGLHVSPLFMGHSRPQADPPSQAPGGLPDIPPRNRGVRPLCLVPEGRGEIRVSMVLSPDSTWPLRHAAPARRSR
jgi:hypothetical protein